MKLTAKTGSHQRAGLLRGRGAVTVVSMDYRTKRTLRREQRWQRKAVRLLAKYTYLRWEHLARSMRGHQSAVYRYVVEPLDVVDVLIGAELVRPEVVAEMGRIVRPEFTYVVGEEAERLFRFERLVDYIVVPRQEWDETGWDVATARRILRDEFGLSDELIELACQLTRDRADSATIFDTVRTLVSAL